MSGKVDEEKNREKKKRENGGRYGFDDYGNSPIKEYEPTGVKAGDKCECCGKGRYYYTYPQRQISFTGNPPLTAERHLKKVLKCNTCAKEVVSDVNITKWSNSARAMIGINKVYGMAWHKQARIQKICGIPVSQSSLWEQRCCVDSQ